jgi:HD superfamily phosphohydrolase YqeK
MTQVALVVNGIALPAWSRVSERRLEHIGRVVTLLDEWAAAMSLSSDEAAEWRDAGAWHDALRDADEHTLRQITGDDERPAGMLHGFAAAKLLVADGESRASMLDAVRWHTVGYPQWSRVGRALYMADFLEPGRKFMQADRAFLASLVPARFDDVFRQVVRMRLEWTVREGKGLAVETVQLWNAVR